MAASRGRLDTVMLFRRGLGALVGGDRIGHTQQGLPPPHAGHGRPRGGAVGRTAAVARGRKCYSVFLPFLPRRPAEVVPYAELVQRTRAERLWQGQALLVETFQGFAAAAGAGYRIPVGVGVTLMPLRHPYEAAHEVRSLALTTGRPVVVGFGPGGRGLQRSLLGAPYDSPLTATREYLSIVRGLLQGQLVEAQGAYFSCHAVMGPAVAPPAGVGLGVLRAGMARLAGELADVAVTWLTPARYLREVVVPALREGAAKARRPAPRLSVIVPVALEEPSRDAAALVLASNGAHMAAEHYVDMLRRAGIALDGRDPSLDAKRMIEGEAFLYGDAEALQSQLDAYRDAGADEIILNLTGTHGVCGAEAARSDLETLLTELT